MYVCICNAVTERTIQGLVAQGYRRLDEIQALTGCSTACGQCREHATAVIEAANSHPGLTVVNPPVKPPVLRSA